MTDHGRFEYGDGPQQFAMLTVPEGTGPHPVVILVHGGFWRAKYELDLMTPLAVDLAGRGFAAWNVEYRRVGQAADGHLATLRDVAAVVDHLAAVAAPHHLDLQRVAVVGHSAGGHLALWVGSRHLLGAGQPGAEPAVRPALVVGQAAVADVVGAAREGLGDNATQDFLGGEPHQVPDAYELAQPAVGATPTTLVHGDADDVVPPDQSTRFAGRDGVEVVVIRGDDHMAVIDPASASWAAVVDAVTRI